MIQVRWVQAVIGILVAAALLAAIFWYLSRMAPDAEPLELSEQSRQELRELTRVRAQAASRWLEP